MAITPGAATSATANNTWSDVSPLTATVPAHSDGDVLICAVQRLRDGELLSADPAWTQIDQQAHVTANAQVALFSRVAASEPATYDFATAGVTSTSGVVLMFASAGVDNSTILDVAYVSATYYAEENATSTPTPKPITTVTDGALVTSIMLKDHNGTITNPTGYTTAVEVSGVGSGRGGAITYLDKATAGLETVPDYGLSTTEDVSMFTIALKPASVGPTLTGPASAQEGDAINAIGTGLTSATLDLVTTVGGHVGAQVTTGVPSDTMWPYTVNPKTGVPFSVVPIQAAGVTLWVTEQQATDGTSANNVMTIAAKTNETVIQGMIATSNTTPGESIFATNILAMEDNLQANPPTLVSGVTITWFADGTFTVDINQAISFTVDFFSPSNSEWQSISLNITAAGVISVGAANTKISINIGIGI